MPSHNQRGHGDGHWLLRAFGIGLLMAGLQVLLLYAWRRPETWFGLYASLVQFDTFWYSDIARNGYTSSVPPSGKWLDNSNVAFFPGYPLLAGELHRLTGIGAGWALIIVSQFAGVVFWTSVAALLGRVVSAAGVVFFSCMLVAAHPAAFFLMTPYSESLFLATAMIFLFVVSDGNGLTAKSYLIGMIAGFLMTATRLAGLPIVASGVLWGLLSGKGGRRENTARFSLAIFSTLGCLSFFAFCHYKWGVWNLYMQTQEAGWGLRAIWWAGLDPRNWLHWDLIRVVREFSEIGDGGQMPQYFNMFLTSFYLLTIVGIVLVEWKVCSLRESGWRDRVPYYAAALGVLALSITGLYSLELRSMVRYSLVVHVLLVIPVVMLVSEEANRGRGASQWLAPLVVLGVLAIAVGFYFQSKIARIFMAGGWTA